MSDQQSSTYSIPAHYVADDDYSVFAEYSEAGGRELFRLPYDEAKASGWLAPAIPYLDELIWARCLTFGIDHQIGLVPTKSPRPEVNDFPSAVRTNSGRSLIVLPAGMVGRLSSLMLNLAYTDSVSALFGLHPPPALANNPDFLPSPQEAALVATMGGNDEIRRLNVIHVALKIAITILADHEFAHIKNGHLDFLISERGRSRNLRQTRALEFDADAFACNMSFRDAQRSVGIFHSVLSDDASHPGAYGWDTLDQAVTFISAVHYIVFRAFADSSIGQRFWTGSHPPAILRAFICATHFEVNLASIGQPSSAEGMARRFIEIIDAVETGLKALGWATPGTSGLTALEILPAYKAEIGLGWNSLRDELDRLKYGGGIAPLHPDPEFDQAPLRESYGIARTLPGWPSPAFAS